MYLTWTVPRRRGYPERVASHLNYECCLCRAQAPRVGQRQVPCLEFTATCWLFIHLSTPTHSTMYIVFQKFPNPLLRSCRHEFPLFVQVVNFIYFFFNLKNDNSQSDYLERRWGSDRSGFVNVLSCVSWWGREKS